MKRYAIFALTAIAVAGCKAKPEQLTWMNAPSDPQVEQYAFQQCIQGTKGPSQTTYNDWDEAIEACRGHASSVSDYCPTGAVCHPSLPDRASVRAILPKDQPHDQ